MKLITSILIVFVMLLMVTNIEGQEIFDAVKNSDYVKVKELVEKDSSLINLKDENGRTPLHWAVLRRNNEIVKILPQRITVIKLADHNQPLDCLTEVYISINSTEFII